MSSMEINHTRIYGVAHCPPLSEQPVTNKPNAYLGYIPDDAAPAVAAASPPPPISHNLDPAIQIYKTAGLDEPNRVQLNNNLGTTYGRAQPQQQLVDLRRTEPQYRVDSPDAPQQSKSVQNEAPVRQTENKVIDAVKQEKQLSKLAFEIEELRSRVDQLATQNQILLNHSFSNQTTTTSNDNSTAGGQPPNHADSHPRDEETRKPWILDPSNRFCFFFLQIVCFSDAKTL